jgi:hypothetical protein
MSGSASRATAEHGPNWREEGQLAMSACANWHSATLATLDRQDPAS